MYNFGHGFESIWGFRVINQTRFYSKSRIYVIIRRLSRRSVLWIYNQHAKWRNVNFHSVLTAIFNFYAKKKILKLTCDGFYTHIPNGTYCSAALPVRHFCQCFLFLYVCHIASLHVQSSHFPDHFRMIHFSIYCRSFNSLFEI